MVKKVNCAVPPPAAFPFQPHFVKIQGYNIHYVEEGDGQPVLFLHGSPTSAYVYRNVIGPVAKATGRRCLAVDLLGFGKSEKPNIQHNCRLHADIIRGFIEALDLRNIALVGEDWGGFFGGYVMTQIPERFQTAVLMETFLWPMTYKEDFDQNFIWPFKLMRSPFGGVFSKGMNLMIEKLIPEHCPISDEALDYYRKSSPTYRSRKAFGDFPAMLPVNGKPETSHKFALELQAGLDRIDFPVLWIQADPGVMVSLTNPCGFRRLREIERKIDRLEVRQFGSGFHFLSEENPDKVAEMISSWLSEQEAQKRQRRENTDRTCVGSPA